MEFFVKEPLDNPRHFLFDVINSFKYVPKTQTIKWDIPEHNVRALLGQIPHINNLHAATLIKVCQTTNYNLKRSVQFE